MEVKQWEREATEELMKTCHIFWAFNKAQLEEGKLAHPLKEGEKYISIGGGGAMPKGNLATFGAGMDSIKKEKARRMKQVKAESAILYELQNHEAFYTGDIGSAWEVLKENYSYAQILEVFNANNKLVSF